MLKYLSSVVVSVLVSVSLVLGLAHKAPSYSVLEQSTHFLTGVKYGMSGPMGVSCSAVAIAPGKVLTAAHCNVEDMKVDGKDAKVVKIDEKKDLMLLAVDVACPCVPVSKTAVKAGDYVVTVGYPFGKHTGKVLVKTEGEVQGVISNPDLFDKFILSVLNIAPGNSGGGIFSLINGKWYVVSIVSNAAEHLSISPSTEMLQEFVK